MTGEEIYGNGEKLPALSAVRAKLISWLEERGWLKQFKNTDTGWDNISVSRSSIRSVVYHGSGQGKVQAIAALPGLIEHGVYLEPQDIGKGMKRHVFAAKLGIANESFVVGFVVHEDLQGRKYYEHELTEMENLGSLASPTQQRGGQTRAGRDSIMNIVRKHLGVKPDVTLEQPRRDSITITPEKYTVILGKHSDLSTLIHETGHIFEEELRRIAASGVDDGRILQDLGKLDAWLSRFDDDAALQTEYDSHLKGIYGDAKFEDLTAGQKEDLRNIAKREYFARGFEAYAREGKTPSDRPLIRRLRTGKWLASGGAEGMNSVRIRPSEAICINSCALLLGYTMSMPVPSTATVLPGCGNAARCA